MTVRGTPIYLMSVLAAGLALSGCVSAGLTTDDARMPELGEVTQSWSTQVTEPYRGKRDDISFISPDMGWYGTGKGKLYQTRNGGDTWVEIANKPGTFIRALGFVDEITGFIGNVGTEYYPGVTDTTPLYRTDDGGVTWQAVDIGETTIAGICAIDLLETDRIYQGNLHSRLVIHAAGRVGGPTGIIRSVDGGESWSAIDMSEHAGMILDVKFFTESEGLIFASTSADMREAEGLILRTVDGGQTWQEVYRSGRAAELVWKGSFPDRMTGYATVQSYDPDREQQLIVKTIDGGLNWVELEMVKDKTARQFGIGFIDENRGWVGTFAGGFYTADGGQSFVKAPLEKGANKIRIIESDAGVSVVSIGTEVQRLDLEWAE